MPHVINVYFKVAVDEALWSLASLYEVEPSLERLNNHPARDSLLIDSIDLPYFRSIAPDQTVQVSVWVETAHADIWNDRIHQEISTRLSRESYDQGTTFLVTVNHYAGT